MNTRARITTVYGICASKLRRKKKKKKKTKIDKLCLRKMLGGDNNLPFACSHICQFCFLLLLVFFKRVSYKLFYYYSCLYHSSLHCARLIFFDAHTLSLTRSLSLSLWQSHTEVEVEKYECKKKKNQNVMNKKLKL